MNPADQLQLWAAVATAALQGGQDVDKAVASADRCLTAALQRFGLTEQPLPCEYQASYIGTDAPCKKCGGAKEDHETWSR